MAALFAVTPAQAGAQLWAAEIAESWVPAFAGMTASRNLPYLSRLGFTGSAFSGSSGQACLG